MPILNGGAVVIQSPGPTSELTGLLTAFNDQQGWWAALILPAAEAPPREELVGKPVQVRASDRLAAARVSDCVSLVGPAPTVQLLMRGEGDPPFAGPR